MVKAIVGANWGDEGKGKITDVLAQNSDVVIRFQGGANAGHTIVNEYGKFALHQLPSGVFNSNVTNIIGNGVAFSVENFVKEMKELKDRGVPEPKILISDRAQIVMPYHVAFDCYEEERLGKNSFGSTKSGIAPFYSDKYSKIGFQINELYDDIEYLKEKIARTLEVKNATLKNLYNKPPISVDEIFNKLMEYRDALAPYVADTFTFLHDACKDGKNILLEGQLGSLKDTDFGIYPMVTSSNTIAGYADGAVGALPHLVQVVFLHTKSKILLQLLKHIQVQLVQVNLFLKSSVMKLTNFVEEVAMVANLVLQQVVLVEWVG